MESRLEAEAEALCRPSWWRRLAAGGADYDEAARKYVEAGNGYKMQKRWADARRCFARAGELSDLADDTVQAANMFTEAGNMVLKMHADNPAAGNRSDAEELFAKACAIYVKSSRFAQAGRLMKQLADDAVDTDAAAALGGYKKAADYFECDEYSKALHSQCIAAYANLIALVDHDYKRAIKLFETEGRKALKNNLLQFGAKEHFLKAFVLQLCLKDPITASVSLQEYKQLDSRFAESREYKLCAAVGDAVEKDDIAAFTQAVSDYDRITPLDKWKTAMLTEIKLGLTQQAERTGDRPVVLGGDAPPPAVPSYPEEYVGDAGDIDLT